MTLHACDTCEGSGKVELETWRDGRALDPGWREVPCPECAGAEWERAEDELAAMEGAEG